MRKLESCVLLLACLLAAPALASPLRATQTDGGSIEINPADYVLDTVAGDAGADLGGEVRIGGPWGLFGDVGYLNVHTTTGLPVLVGSTSTDSQSLTLDSFSRTSAQFGARRYFLSHPNVYLEASVVFQSGAYHYTDTDGDTKVDSSIDKNLETIGPEVGAGYRWIFRSGFLLRLGGGLMKPIVLDQSVDDHGTGTADKVSSVDGLLSAGALAPMLTINLGMHI